MPRRIHPTHEVDIIRRIDDTSDSDVDTNAIGEPILASGSTDRENKVETAVPFGFDSESTEWVRLESGERVQKPATGTVPGDTDVKEGDRIEHADLADLEVRGIEEVRDRRKNAVISLRLDLERVD